MYSSEDHRPAYYIGIATTFHDPAIAIVDQTGKILFAEATERPLQDKRAVDQRADSFAQMPALLRRYCDPEAELVIATTWSRLFSKFLGLGALAGRFTLPVLRRHSTDRGRSLLSDFELRTYASLVHATQERAGIGILTAAHQAFGHRRVRLERYEHHRTHAAHACLTSPFETAICAVVDGMGELGSIAIYHYQGGKIRRLSRQIGSQSLGFFYAMLTDMCGFQSALEEQWKVMGLAAYGKPDAELEQMLHDLCFVKSRRLRIPGRHQVRKLTEAIRRRIGSSDGDPMGAAALAHAGQEIFCRNMTTLLRPVADLRLSDNLVLAGGCALNSAYNGRALSETGFRHLYVPAAPADDGNAIGAALLAQRRRAGGTPWHPGQHGSAYPYLGSELSSEALKRMDTLGLRGRVQRPGDGLAEKIAGLLATGRVVGWLEGRAEFGPRALGHRSILADPRNPGMGDHLNRIVKFREAFRPFAPSILDEHGPDYFADYQFSPYMERALRFRPDKATQVPAVVHADGTGRVQSVLRDRNPRFHALIEAFAAQTGIPILLNTSCNVMHKPMVHAVEDALGLFYTSGLDVLVLEDLVIEKHY
jgi:carbamoyltransferase